MQESLVVYAREFDYVCAVKYVLWPIRPLILALSLSLSLSLSVFLSLSLACLGAPSLSQTHTHISLLLPLSVYRFVSPQDDPSSAFRLQSQQFPRLHNKHPSSLSCHNYHEHLCVCVCVCAWCACANEGGGQQGGHDREPADPERGEPPVCWCSPPP